jgi:hypothetical protein
MAASVKVAKMIGLSVLGSATLLTWLHPRPSRTGTAARFVTLVSAAQWIVSGLVHAYKADGGSLSIAQGKGWHIPGGGIAPQQHTVISFFAIWGDLWLTLSGLQCWFEFTSPTESAVVVNGALLASALNQLVVLKWWLGKDHTKSAKQAPGRFASAARAVVIGLAFALSVCGRSADKLLLADSPVRGCKEQDATSSTGKK